MYYREAVGSLYAHKQRSILALIGIIIGIASVISLVSIGQIVTTEATKEFRELGTDVIRVILYSDNMADLRQPSLFTRLPQYINCIKNSAPVVHYYSNLETALGDDVPLLGVEQSFQDFTRANLAAGRFISILDDKRPYAVLGADMPKILNLKKNTQALIGEKIVVEKHTYQIVGVLKPMRPVPSVGLDANNTIFTPIKQLLKTYPQYFISLATLRTHQDVDVSVCAQQVRHYFMRRLNPLELQVTTADELIAKIRKQADMLAVLLTAIGSISLLVGGVGIMNIMLVSVSERRQEIGILRALGAKRQHIRAQFLTEALLLSFIGGMIGIVLSIIVTYYVAVYNTWQFFISFEPILLGAGISVFIGVFFGFFPAHQAAALDPIKALRGE